MSWRPEGFYELLDSKLNPHQRHHIKLIELVSDAMLEALRKMGVHHIKGVTEYGNYSEFDKEYTPDKSETCVFIPDDGGVDGE